MASVFPFYKPSTPEISLGVALLGVVSVLVITQAAGEDPPALATAVVVFHFVTVAFVVIDLFFKGKVAPIAMGTIGSGIVATLFQTAVVGAASDVGMPALLLAFQCYANALQLAFIIADLRIAVSGRNTAGTGTSGWLVGTP